MIFMTAVMMQLGVSFVGAQSRGWDDVKDAYDQEVLEHSHVLVKENVAEGGLVKITLSNGLTISVKQDSSQGWAPVISSHEKSIEVVPDRWMPVDDVQIHNDSMGRVLWIERADGYIRVFSSGATREEFQCHHHDQVFTSFTTPYGLKVMQLKGALLIKGEGRVECGNINCIGVAQGILDGSITTLEQVRGKISRKH